MRLNHLMSLLLILIVATACVSSGGHTGSEVLSAPDEFGTVTYSHCFTSGHMFHALGGITPHEDLSPLNSKGVSYNLDQKIWDVWPTRNGPAPKGNFSAAQIGLNIYVFGGEEKSRRTSNDLFVFDSFKQEWTRIGQNAKIIGRRSASLTAVGGSLVLFGGQTEDHQNNWGKFDTSTQKWTAFDSFTKERISNIAVAVDSKVFIWGGFEGKIRSDEGLLLFPLTGAIETIPKSPLLDARANAKAVGDGTRVYILGGMGNDGPKFDGAVYDVRDKTWTKIPAFTHTRKAFEMTLIPDKGLLVWGGREVDNTFQSAAFLLDQKTLIWRTVEIPNAPRGRLAHCLGTIDGRLYVFGGLSGDKTGGNLETSDELTLIPFGKIP
ncbi:MAG: hypothetical protein H7249_00660 [Chitinophagaceae bacterium]|nr:hypothetical protein [Oligoflexus sp.]